MGIKQMWNGEGLPENGDEVYIHLSSINRWVKHVVTGVRIAAHADGDRYHHRIFIKVKRNGLESSENERLLCDVKPLDYFISFDAGEDVCQQ